MFGVTPNWCRSTPEKDHPTKMPKKAHCHFSHKTTSILYEEGMNNQVGLELLEEGMNNHIGKNDDKFEHELHTGGRKERRTFHTVAPFHPY